MAEGTISSRSASPSEVLGARLRQYRTASRRSLRELGERTGVSAASISAYENGRTQISVRRLQTFADELGVTLADLLDPRVEPTTPARTPHDPAGDDTWRSYGPLALNPVLTAALAAIRDTGYHGCTVREIADRAGLSVPGIYHHYRSKQEMLVALFDLTMADLLRRSHAARDQGSTPAEKFALMVESLALYHTNRRDLGLLGATEMRSLLPHSRRRIADLRVDQQRMIDVEVELAVRDGSFRTPFPHDAARAVVTMCTALPQWFDPSGSVTAQRVAELYVGFALNLVGAQPTQ